MPYINKKASFLICSAVLAIGITTTVQADWIYMPGESSYVPGAPIYVPGEAGTDGYYIPGETISVPGEDVFIGYKPPEGHDYIYDEERGYGFYEESTVGIYDEENNPVFEEGTNQYAPGTYQWTTVDHPVFTGANPSGSGYLTVTAILPDNIQIVVTTPSPSESQGGSNRYVVVNGMRVEAGTSSPDGTITFSGDGGSGLITILTENGYRITIPVEGNRLLVNGQLASYEYQQGEWIDGVQQTTVVQEWGEGTLIRTYLPGEPIYVEGEPIWVEGTPGTPGTWVNAPGTWVTSPGTWVYAPAVTPAPSTPVVTPTPIVTQPIESNIYEATQHEYIYIPEQEIPLGLITNELENPPHPIPITSPIEIITIEDPAVPLAMPETGDTTSPWVAFGAIASAVLACVSGIMIQRYKKQYE